MILSNREIQKALDEKRLIITPEPSPREKVADQPCPYNSTSVDLKLGTEIVWYKDSQPINLDLSRGSISSFLSANSEKRSISRTEPFLLHPNHFILAKTLETVQFPIVEAGSVCLSARVEGRSSFARCGILVHFTAPTIHAGFKGTITLEMINLGRYSVQLYSEMYICQLIIEEVKGTPFANPSQFQNQSRPEGA